MFKGTLYSLRCNYNNYYCFFIFIVQLFLVRFRFIVFRPFIDEVIVGKIKSSSSEGVRGTS